jgi:WD40 repeat protein
MVLEGHRFPVQALAFDKDGTTWTSVAYFTSDRGSEVEVAIWNGKNEKRALPLTTPLRDLVALCFGSSGQTFAAAGKDRSVWLVDRASPRRLGESPAPIFALAFSEETGLVATADAENVVRLWDAAGDESRICCRTTSPVRALAFAPGGKLLAIGDYQKVRLWEVARDKELNSLPAPAHASTILAFSADVKMLASGDVKGVVTLWDWITGEVRDPLGTSAEGTFLNEVTALAFSPDGQTLAVAVDRTVRLWEVVTGRLLARLEGHTGKVKCLAYSPDSRRLVSGGYDQTVRLWNLAEYLASNSQP